MCVTSIFRKEFLKDYTFADSHLLTGVTSYDGELITDMFFVLVLRILKIWASPCGRHVMVRHGLHHFSGSIFSKTTHLLMLILKGDVTHVVPLRDAQKEKPIFQATQLFF